MSEDVKNVYWLLTEQLYNTYKEAEQALEMEIPNDSIVLDRTAHIEVYDVLDTYKLPEGYLILHKDEKYYVGLPDDKRTLPKVDNSNYQFISQGYVDKEGLIETLIKDFNNGKYTTRIVMFTALEDKQSIFEIVSEKGFLAKNLSATIKGTFASMTNGHYFSSEAKEARKKYKEYRNRHK